MSGEPAADDASVDGAACGDCPCAGRSFAGDSAVGSVVREAGRSCDAVPGSGAVAELRSAEALSRLSGWGAAERICAVVSADLPCGSLGVAFCPFLCGSAAVFGVGSCPMPEAACMSAPVSRLPGLSGAGLRRFLRRRAVVGVSS